MSKKRELIEPQPGDKRYVRRDAAGAFTEDQVDVGIHHPRDDELSSGADLAGTRRTRYFTALADRGNLAGEPGLNWDGVVRV